MTALTEKTVRSAARANLDQGEVLGAVARHEAEVRRNRIRLGIAAAKAAGKRVGGQPGPRKIKGDLAERVKVFARSHFSYLAIARMTGLNYRTVRKFCEERRL